jgi:putative nucleotidyltransferase with HDIG domain
MLAERSLQMAAGRESRVVDAQELSEHAAASIELAAAYGIADLVDSLDPRGDHSVRVSAYASDLARELQLELDEVAAVGLGARLHDIGKAHWGAEAFEIDSERAEEARREHSARGAQMVQTGAGPLVTAIVKSHHERWDGAGLPEGLSGNDIPLGARVLAVAHMYDELALSGASVADIGERLRTDAGVTLDPDLVEVAIALFAKG